MASNSDWADLKAEVERLRAAEDGRQRQADELARVQRQLDELNNKAPSRATKDLGTKQGYRLCTSHACDHFLVKHPVPLVGTETVHFMKDSEGNFTDRVENSTTTWDFLSVEDSRCGGCDTLLGKIDPDAQEPAAGFDDLTAPHRRRVRIGDEDPKDVREDIERMRERQAKVLAEMEKANRQVQEAVEDDL
jgi:hypothetical protein